MSPVREVGSTVVEGSGRVGVGENGAPARRRERAKNVVRLVEQHDLRSHGRRTRSVVIIPSMRVCIFPVAGRRHYPRHFTEVDTEIRQEGQRTTGEHWIVVERGGTQSTAWWERGYDWGFKDTREIRNLMSIRG